MGGRHRTPQHVFSHARSGHDPVSDQSGQQRRRLERNGCDARADGTAVRLANGLVPAPGTDRAGGCGFDAGEANSAGGIGLRNMTERVHILGGKLKVDSQPNRGTRIEVTIPIPDAE